MQLALYNHNRNMECQRKKTGRSIEKKRRSSAKSRATPQKNKITNYFAMGVSASKLENQHEETEASQPEVAQEELKMKWLPADQQEQLRPLVNRCLSLHNQVEEERLQAKNRQLVIAKSMLELADYRRAQRRKINGKLGHFIENFKVFIEGPYLKEFLETMKSIQESKSKLKEKLKRMRYGDREYLSTESSLSYKQKELRQMQEEYERRMKEIVCYRERLKLAEKERSCRFALDNWPIIYDRYQTLELIGSGGFGQVYKSYDLQNHKIVAIKRMSISKEHQHQSLFRHIQREVDIHHKLDHPNIARLQNVLEVNEQKGFAIFELQYCSGPELSVYMRKYGTVAEKEAKQIVKQLLYALKYLASLKERVIHYDLKPSNIMFHEGVIKILDFGLCKAIENSEDTRIELTSQGAGTYWYLPPESFEPYNPQISSKVDIWSVGVIFYEMLFGVKPFGQGIPQIQLYQRGIILGARKVEFPHNSKGCVISQAAKDFIHACLKYNPSDRFDPISALSHPYMRKD